MYMNNSGIGYVVATVLTVLITIIASLLLWGHMTSISYPIGYEWKSVGIKVSVDRADHIELTYIGGQYHQKLSRLMVKGQNSNGVEMKFYSPANASHSTSTTAVPNLIINDPSVGTTIFTENGTIDQDHIVVVAEFSDGTTHVILDTWI